MSTLSEQRGDEEGIPVLKVNVNAMNTGACRGGGVMCNACPEGKKYKFFSFLLVKIASFRASHDKR